MRSKSLLVYLLLLAPLCCSLSAIEVDISDWKRLESILETLKQDNERLTLLLDESKTALDGSKQELMQAQEELTMLRQSLSGILSSLEKLGTSLQNTSDRAIWWAVTAGTLGLLIGGYAGSTR